MSTAPQWRVHAPPEAETEPTSEEQMLHRVREVRKAQGVSRRAAARRLGVEPRQLDAMEQPSTDLPLSAIYHWQQILQVPIEDLLVESEEPLSRPVLERAQMLKLMKTAVTIRNRAKSRAVRHLAEMLVDQLRDIMPDMSEVAPWSSHSEAMSHDGENGFDRAQAESEFLDNLLNR